MSSNGSDGLFAARNIVFMSMLVAPKFSMLKIHPYLKVLVLQGSQKRQMVVNKSQRSAASKARRIRRSENRTQMSAITLGNNTNGAANLNNFPTLEKEDWGESDMFSDLNPGSRLPSQQAQRMRSHFSNRLRVFAGTANPVSSRTS